MNGIVNVYKEKAMTSHDVVNIARKIFKTKKVGHTGTLDPDATGVLPICIGEATKISQYLIDKDKVYIAELKFGNETDTQDSSGEIISSSELPTVSINEFNTLCKQFLGKQIQTPPMYSAVKCKGKPLYKYAREGIIIKDIPSREIEVYSIDVLEYNSEVATLKIHCSKGTYIRTLCSDISKKANSSSYLTRLERIKSGHFTREKSVTLEVLKSSPSPDSFIQPVMDALVDLPKIQLSYEDLKKVKNGMSINYTSKDNDIVMATYENSLIAIGSLINNSFKPRKVFHAL